MFWTILLSIIAFVLILTIIIGIHEFSHFIWAKKAGVLCHEFSIGMGPLIYQKKRGETWYSIRAIPIGGFVSMAGEDINEALIKPGQKIALILDEKNAVDKIVVGEKKIANPEDNYLLGTVVSYDLYGKDMAPLFIEMELEDGNIVKYDVNRVSYYVFDKGNDLQLAPHERSFESKTIWQRFLSIVAGPVSNIILALLIFLIYSFVIGVPNNDSNVVGEISEGYPAYNVVNVNDEITGLSFVNLEGITESYTISSWDEFSTYIDAAKAKGITQYTLLINDEKTATLDSLIAIYSFGITNAGAQSYDGAGIKVGSIGNPCNKCGIEPGDVITGISIDNEYHAIGSWTDILLLAYDTDIANVAFEYYKEDDTDFHTKLVSDKFETYGKELLSGQNVEVAVISIGVSPKTHFEFGKCFVQALSIFWTNFTIIFATLGQLISPKSQVGLSDLSGPIGIFTMVKSYLEAGFLPLFYFMGFLSVNIGMLNILPIPALDGGRIFFLIIEAIIRRPLNKKVESTINNVIFILILLLFVYVAFNDVLRLF